MLEGLRYKFTYSQDLKQKLLETGNARLIESTNAEAFWSDGGDGSGRNMMGVLLMKVRGEIMANPNQFIPQIVNGQFQKLKSANLSDSQDRSVGCILGAFTGDSLGSYLEFMTGVMKEKEVD